MSETAPKASSWRRIAPLLAVSVAGVLVYSNSFGGPFVFDDIHRIVENPAIRTAWPPSVVMAETNRPFAFYTFALNYAVHGYHLWGYHATNLAVHIAAGLFLFGIVRRSLLRGEGKVREHADGLALIASLIWLLHPLQTQAVNYTVQRLESLMGLSYVATLYCFIRSQDAQRPIAWQTASVLACAFGMGCKEVMASAPLIVLWYDRAFIAASWRELVSRRKYYYAALALTWGVLAWAMLHFTGDYTGGTLVSVEGLTPWTYLVSQAGVLVHYLRLCFWPSGQCCDYRWPITSSLTDVLPQALLIVSLLGLTVWSIFRRPKWSFLGGWFFLILAPTSSVMPIQDLAFEHRMYLPSAAVLVAAVLGGAWLLQSVAAKRLSDAALRRVSLSLALAVIVGLGIATHSRNSVYASKISFWGDVAEQAPQNARAWINLGCALYIKGDRAEALECGRRAMEIDPDGADVRSNFAGMLVQEGEYEAAIACLQPVLDDESQLMTTHFNMGEALSGLGRFSEALEHYRIAFELFPSSDETLISLTDVLLHLGRSSEAVDICEAVLQEHPAFANAHRNLAFALLVQGQVREAGRHFEQALNLDPYNAEAHAGIGQILAGVDPRAASDHLAQALRLAPKSAQVNITMGNVSIASRPAEAVSFFETALKSQPKNPEALFGLANAWAASGRPEKAIPYLEETVEVAPQWQQAKDILLMLRKNGTQSAQMGPEAAQ